MEKQSFEIFEWRIDNFSYWDERIHGEKCASPLSSGLDNVKQLFLILYSRHSENLIEVQYSIKHNSIKSCAKLTLMSSDGSVVYTKILHSWKICDLKFKDLVSRIKNKGDQLIIRLSVLSSVGKVDVVSTTFDLLKITTSVDPLLIKGMKKGDTKNISIIHYNKKNYMDEMLLKAVCKYDETVEIELELLHKSVEICYVESHWCLESSNTSTRSKDNKYVFSSCGTMKVSTLSLSELNKNNITMLLALNISIGGKTEKRVAGPFNDIRTTVPKRTICFFEQNSFQNSNDSVSSNNNRGDSVRDLLKDMMGLLQDQDLSDLTLNCGDVTFPVHSAILSARSPVFKSMLSSDMREASSGQVDIGDLHPSTLSRLLIFLYTGQVEEGLDGESALNLYYAADKYQVLSLKKECVDFLCSNVSFSNVCDILSLTDKYEEETLLRVSDSFILKNYNQVLKSKEWGKFMEEEPLLALKTLTRFAQENRVISSA